MNTGTKGGVGDRQETLANAVSYSVLRQAIFGGESYTAICVKGRESLAVEAEITTTCCELTCTVQCTTDREREKGTLTHSGIRTRDVVYFNH